NGRFFPNYEGKHDLPDSDDFVPSDIDIFLDWNTERTPKKYSSSAPWAKKASSVDPEPNAPWATKLCVIKCGNAHILGASLFTNRTVETARVANHPGHLAAAHKSYAAAKFKSTQDFRIDDPD